MLKTVVNASVDSNICHCLIGFTKCIQSAIKTVLYCTTDCEQIIEKNTVY